MARIRLENILVQKSYMKVLIDESVEKDNNGNYLINVCYMRVSTDKQADEGFGLEIQEDELMTYAKNNRLTNLVAFIDDGFTGTNMDRPALNGITDIITGFNDGKNHIHIERFIVPRIDRLGRTLLGILQFIQDYIVASNGAKSTINKNEEDISFISIKESFCKIDKNDPTSKFMFSFFCGLAEFDRDMIVQKLKQGRTQRVAKGFWMGGGNCPFGYKYDKEIGELIVVPEQAKIVEEIYRLYIEEKMSPAKIANRFGIKSEKQISDILKRKTYTGAIVYNGVEYQGIHESIISLERWQEAQEEIESRSVVRFKSNYLLTGLLYCGECGAKLRYQKWDKKTGACKLVCYSQQKSKPHLVKDENCDNIQYWATDIEDVVVEELFKLTYLQDKKNKKSTAIIEPLKVLNEDLKREEAKLSKLYNFDTDDDDDVIKEKITNQKALIRDIKSQIKTEEQQAAIRKKIVKAENILHNLKGTWQYMSDKEKQNICRELIDKIIIYKNGSIDVHLKLKSYFKNAL